MARPTTILTELPPIPSPHPPRRGRIGLVIATSLLIGAVAALVLDVVVFAGAREHVITGTALLGFALGWGLLALWSGRRTSQPQQWALVPAAFLGLSGVALLLLTPSDRALTLLGWVWPPALLALAGWMVNQARRSLFSWSRVWLIYPVCAVTALVGVAGAVETVRATSASNTSAAGQTYDVGGHRLYLECSGAGSPTVVLTSGFGSHTPSWAWIAPAVAVDTRVCTYDRAGEGRSDPATGPQDGVQLAADLHALLAKANVPGPYVLVGHSVGGPYSLVFAARYPTEVAGMVLLDATSPHQFALIPSYSGVYETFRRATALFPSLARLGLARPAFGTGFTELPPAARDQEREFAVSNGELRGERDEWSQFPAAFRQAQAMTDFGTKPLLVLTAGTGQDPGWSAAQDQLAALSHNSAHHTVSGATHEALLIDRNFAASSAQGVRDVVQAARAGTPLRP
jgi:pimeloyl-ACP methyl ester carboxylesterase